MFNKCDIPDEPSCVIIWTLYICTSPQDLVCLHFACGLSGLDWNKSFRTAQSPLALIIHNATVHHVAHLLKSDFRLQVWSIPAISCVTKCPCYTTVKPAIPACLAQSRPSSACSSSCHTEDAHRFWKRSWVPCGSAPLDYLLYVHTPLLRSIETTQLVRAPLPLGVIGPNLL